MWRGLDSLDWCHKLDLELRRVGYVLGRRGDDGDDEVAVDPLGSGPRFVLQIRHLQELGWFAVLSLNSEEAEPIADWFLDTNEKHARSCYDVWIDWFVDAVRSAKAGPY